MAGQLWQNVFIDFDTFHPQNVKRLFDVNRGARGHHCPSTLNLLLSKSSAPFLRKMPHSNFLDRYFSHFLLQAGFVGYGLTWSK